MTKIEDPDMIELRGWVMLMLQRTHDTGILQRYRLLHNTANARKALFDSLN